VSINFLLHTYKTTYFKFTNSEDKKALKKQALKIWIRAIRTNDVLSTLNSSIHRPEILIWQYLCKLVKVVSWNLFESVIFFLISRSSRLSVFQRGMSNWVLNFAIVFETLIALILIYIPGLNSGLQVQYPLHSNLSKINCDINCD